MNKERIDFSAIINIILCFMFIFGFRIVSFIDSTILVGGFLAVSFCLNKAAFTGFYKKLKSINFFYIVLTYLLLFIWCTICVIINGQSDFSFLKTTLHLLINIIIGLGLYSYYESHSCSKYIPKYLIISFFLQSIIIILGIINTPFRNLLLLTKTEQEVILANHYDFRGASLCGSSFFGLAISYALFFIIYVNETKGKNQNLVLYLITFTILVVAALSAGRTAVVGLGIAILFYGMRFRPKRLFKLILIAVSLVILAIISTSIIFPSLTKELNNTLNYFWYYITEFFSSENGSFLSSTSTDFMFSTMFFVIDFKTLVLGDGLYNTKTGYYMSTDSGYMRPILYAGVIALILLLLLQIQIVNFGKMQKKDKKLFYAIMLLILVLQIKGEVMGFAIVFNNIALLFSLSFTNSNVEVIDKTSLNRGTYDQNICIDECL